MSLQDFIDQLLVAIRHDTDGDPDQTINLLDIATKYGIDPARPFWIDNAASYLSDTGYIEILSHDDDGIFAAIRPNGVLRAEQLPNTLIGRIEEANVKELGPGLANDSSKWTGLPAGFELNDELRQRLVRDLDSAEASLGDLEITQFERSQARAYIIAMRVLAEAPEPPADLIWQLLSRANELAGVASLFVSIAALFVSVS